MKRKALTALTILVMCLIMAFPASAATIAPPGAFDLLDYTKTFKNPENFEAIKARAHAKVPAEYKYTLVTAGSNLGYSDYIIFSTTPVISVGSSVYIIHYVTTIPETESGNINHSVNLANIMYKTISSIALPTYPSPITYEGNSITYNYIKVNFTNNTVYPYIQTIWILSEYSTASFDGVSGFGITLPEMIDTSALEALLSDADQIEDNDYTQSTWANFTSARSSGHALLNSTGYTQAQINNATNALQNAMNALEKNPQVDTTALRALLVTADDMEDVGYTPPTWQRFDTARYDSHELLARTAYTQPQVDGSYTELDGSMKALTLAAVSKPDISIPPIGGMNAMFPEDGITMEMVAPMVDYLEATVAAVLPFVFGIIILFAAVLLVRKIVGMITHL